MNKRQLLFLIPGILFFVGRLAAQPPSAIPGFLKETQEGMVRNEVIGGRAPGRNYSGFGDALKAPSLGWSQEDCVVIRVGAMGFSRGFVCGKESQDPEDKVEGSQSIVPYAFYAKKYLSQVLRVRARGRNYAGFGYEEKELGLLQFRNGSFWLLGVRLNKKKKENQAGNPPGKIFENFQIEKNLATWVSNPLSIMGSDLTSQTEFHDEYFTAGETKSVSSLDFSSPANLRAIERHFFDGGGARGHDGISQPSQNLPALSES